MDIYSAQPVTQPNPWKKRLVIGIPVIIVIVFLLWWPGCEDRCKGWECDGSYVILNDTTVTLFNTDTLLHKNDTLQVKNKTFVVNRSGRQSNVPEDELNTNTIKFDYLPPEVSSPSKIKGIIELGSRNFSYFVVRMDAQHNWDTIKTNRNSTSYSQLMTGNATYIEQMFSQYIEDMMNDWGVPGRNIYFVVSSGAILLDTVKMVKKHLEHIGFIVKVVTEDEEGMFALQAVLPRDFYNRPAFVVDMGSGNTKIAWKNADNSIGTSTTYGSKAVRDLKLPLETVLRDYERASGKVPENKRGLCFMIGGLPWELSKLTKSDNDRYICLKSANCYHLEGWKSDGIAMYDKITQTTGCRQFVFDKKATFSIGYLVYGRPF